MNRVSKLGWTAYGLAVAIVALDQMLKLWVVEILQLPLRGSVPVLGPLRLSFVQNNGVSFGLLQGETEVVRWGLTAFSLIVAAVIVYWARRPERPLTGLGYGLIIGGAIGNAIDRARLGYVIDYIDVQQLGFFPWVFNLADSAITVGVIAILLDSLRRDRAA